jgi:hypothetical protein
MHRHYRVVLPGPENTYRKGDIVHADQSYNRLILLFTAPVAATLLPHLATQFLT